MRVFVNFAEGSRYSRPRLHQKLYYMYICLCHLLVSGAMTGWLDFWLFFKTRKCKLIELEFPGVLSHEAKD